MYKLSRASAVNRNLGFEPVKCVLIVATILLIVVRTEIKQI